MRQAFTLVEILVVIVILGILAAIVVPQFAGAAEDARATNLATTIRQVEAQLELYLIREGAYPPITTDWNPMIDNGYLKSAPVNPVNQLDTVTAGTTGDATYGWHFDDSDGAFGASYYDETNKEITSTP